jgi:hypothetical protein
MRKILLGLFVIIVCSSVAIAAPPKAKPYVYENGKTYRYNERLKQYKVYKTPAEKAGERYLKINGGKVNTNPTGTIKWWDFYFR